MTREEKRQVRLRDYLSGESITFRDARAGKLNKERAARQVKAMMCREPG